MGTTMTSKGQVTVPKTVRDHLGIGPGSKIRFSLGPDGKVVVEAEGAAESPVVSRFRRFRGHATSGLTTEEIMALTRGD